MKATENEDGSLNPKSLRYPYIHSLSTGGYEVLAIRTLADGEPDEECKGKVLAFYTEDFVSYTEQGIKEPTEEYLALTALWDSGESVDDAKKIFSDGTVSTAVVDWKLEDVDFYVLCMQLHRNLSLRKRAV